MVRTPSSPASWLAMLCCGALAAQHTPDDALRALTLGNDRFVAGRAQQHPLGAGVRATLARGQGPRAIVVCCADSQLPPEHVFDAGLGELFVVRTAGHVVDAETIASIEHAAERLAVPLCVVLGHESCGAVAAAVARATGGRDDAPSDAFRRLLERIEPAVRPGLTRELGPAALRTAAEEEHAQLSVHECLARSQALRRLAAAGTFRIVAAHCRLTTGAVEWLPARPLPPAPADEATGAAAAVANAPAGVPPHTALRLLRAGHRRFLGDGPSTGDVTASRREALQHGQQPIAIVLTCTDARLAPEHVFDAGLGELFVVRTGGAALTDGALASIEYAAARLGASLMLVMAHTKCEPDAAAHALQVAAAASAKSAVLRALEQQGRFDVLPCVYDVATGDLAWPTTDEATAPPPPPAAPIETASAPEFFAPAPAGETRPARPAPPSTVIEPSPPAAVPLPAAAAPSPVTEKPLLERIDLRLAGAIAGAVSLLAAVLLALKSR